MFAHWLFLAELDLIIAMLLFCRCSAFWQVQCHHNLWLKPIKSINHDYLFFHFNTPFFKHSFHLNAISFNLFLFLFSALFTPTSQLSTSQSHYHNWTVVLLFIWLWPRLQLVWCHAHSRKNECFGLICELEKVISLHRFNEKLSCTICIEKMVLYLILTSWLEWKVLCSFPCKVYWRG